MNNSIKQSKQDTKFFPAFSVGKRWTPQHSQSLESVSNHIARMCPCARWEKEVAVRWKCSLHQTLLTEVRLPSHFTEVRCKSLTRGVLSNRLFSLKFLCFPISITSTNLKRSSGHNFLIFLKSIPYRLIIETFFYCRFVSSRDEPWIKV